MFQKRPCLDPIPTGKQAKRNLLRTWTGTEQVDTSSEVGENMLHTDQTLKIHYPADINFQDGRKNQIVQTIISKMDLGGQGDTLTG